MSFEKGALIILFFIWCGFGVIVWLTLHDKYTHPDSPPPKIWKLALILPLCGPIPIIVIWLVTLGRLFEKATDTLARWITK